MLMEKWRTLTERKWVQKENLHKECVKQVAEPHLEQEMGDLWIKGLAGEGKKNWLAGSGMALGDAVVVCSTTFEGGKKQWKKHLEVWQVSNIHTGLHQAHSAHIFLYGNTLTYKIYWKSAGYFLESQPYSVVCTPLTSSCLLIAQYHTHNQLSLQLTTVVVQFILNFSFSLKTSFISSLLPITSLSSASVLTLHWRPCSSPGLEWHWEGP